MKLLTRRVTKGIADEVRADLKAIDAKVGGGETLGLGDSGKSIEGLQRHLKATGIYEGPVDGKYSDELKAALSAFQKRRGLEGTGEVDGKTLAALRKINLFVKDGFEGTPARLGQRGRDIAQVEAQLEKLGFQPGEVDGVFDEATAKALTRFRKSDKDVMDEPKAVIGANLAKELRKAAATFDHAPFRHRDIMKKASERAAAARLDDRTGKRAASDALVKGDKGALVKNLERHLNAAGYSVGKANESFGARTEAALKAFQAKAGLNATGELNGATWSKLRGALFSAKTGTSPAQAKGERGGSVAHTEKLLKKLGYKGVRADGTFDGRTERAVKAFQKKHEMKPTGKVGPKTAKAIQKAVSDRSGGAFVKKLLAEARSHLGYHEGANNANMFARFWGRDHEAWCADFVNYCIAKAGGPKHDLPGVDGLLAYFRNKGTFHRSNPKPGDVIIFDWDRTDSDPSEHTGLVEKVFQRNGQTWVQTIEGNSSDMVKRRQIPVSSNVIVGFGTEKR